MTIFVTVIGLIDVHFCVACKKSLLSPCVASLLYDTAKKMFIFGEREREDLD